MNKDFYHSKYLKYKMKYLHEKSLQLGGREVEAIVNVLDSVVPRSVIETLNIIYNDEQNVRELKNKIFEKSGGRYPVEKQIISKGARILDNGIILKNLLTQPESVTFFDLVIKKAILSEAQVTIFDLNSKAQLEILSIIFDNESPISDIKQKIFEKSDGRFPVEKQVLKYKGVVPSSDSVIFNRLFPLIESIAFFEIYIKK